MSVKFEIADWRFELTLKEMICQPIENEKTGAKKARWNDAQTNTTDGELLSAEFIPQNCGREQAVIL